VRFTLSITQQGQDASLHVSNDGAPVPVDIAARIFDPYISTKSGADNMGLGLAIVKKIVLEHGGDVRYEEEGGKPTFILTLPLNRA
jgi:signal transduction histidine kinase